MSISYAVDLAELDAVIAAMSTFEKTLTARIADLDAEIEQLQGVWHGAAADAQADAHSRLVHGARTMHQALVEMRSAARVAHQNYTAAAEANATMFRRARG